MVTTLPWRKPPLTKAQADLLFMPTLEDDTEDSPSMVMGDLQFWSASGFAHSLRTYGHEMSFGWYVGSMLPIRSLSRNVSQTNAGAGCDGRLHAGKAPHLLRRDG